MPAQTFVATAEAVIQAGGVPVLADVDEATACLDPDAADAAVTARTRFLMPVHLFGQLADMAGCRPSPTATASSWSRTPRRRTMRSATAAGRRFRAAAAFSFYPGRTSAPWATPARW